jgi:capsid assembly protease
MNFQHDLITRPFWAITPDGFAALLGQISSRNFFKAEQFASLKPAAMGTSKAKVMVIPVQGVLTKDSSWAGTTYGSIADAAEEAAADPAVKRIVLAVDSPGGEVTGLPETAAVLNRVAKVKPVHAMVEGTSASAAYWLTSQASDITLAPSAEVGSVGVRIMHADISKMLEDAGIKITEMHAGEFKTEWSPFSPLTDAARENMQGRIDSVHKDFLRDIGQGRGPRATRNITAAQYGGGRMFNAADAMGHGLADRVQAPREFYRDITTVSGEDPSLMRARLALERCKF